MFAIASGPMGESVIAPPPPLPPQRPPGNERRFAIQVAAIAALIVLGGVIGYSEWKSNQPSMDGLTTMVLESMNQSLSDDKRFRDLGLHVRSITIMRASGNMFEGQAVVTTRKNADHTVPVHILYDGESMIWQTDQGALLFAVQEQLAGGS